MTNTERLLALLVLALALAGCSPSKVDVYVTTFRRPEDPMNCFLRLREGMAADAGLRDGVRTCEWDRGLRAYGCAVPYVYCPKDSAEFRKWIAGQIDDLDREAGDNNVK